MDGFVGILTQVSKVKPNICADVSLDQLLNSLNINFLTGKAIEQLAEKGIAGNGLKDHESLLNAIYYLVAELEENHEYCKDEWAKSDIIQHIKDL